jgi:DNA-binding transcriptional regulator YhcF (GntR family)
MAKLPATRKFAHDLGVSRNTVITAYDALLT